MVLKIQTSGNCKLWAILFIFLPLISNTLTIGQKPSHATDTLTIFHFNDVYELAPTSSEPKQGAAYFKALLDRYKFSKTEGNISDHTLTFFSGDVFSPSLLSSEYGGWNMIKPLNSLGIDAACYGNHEFDYSIESIKKLVNATNFPWIFSNVFDKKTGRRLVQAQEYTIFNKLNYKIGVFALTQQQWIHTIIPQYLDRCEIKPFVEFGKLMVNKLRNQLGCDFIIALTHMMKHNDIILAENVQGIDLILGGHDHTIMHQKVNDIVIIKSGSDFQYFTKVQITKIDSNKQLSKPVALPGQKIQTFQTKKYDIQCTLVQVNHEVMKIVPDPEIHAYVNDLLVEFNSIKQRIVLYISSDIDLRSQTVRTSQSPYLNFIAELYRWDRGADCAIINSGAFREGKIMPKGAMTLGTFMNFIVDDVRVKNVTGKQIIWLLENSISVLPSLSGRYSQLAGIEFVWDDSKQPYNRILHSSVKIQGKPIELERVYKVAFRGFIAEGGDGNLLLKDCPYIEEIMFKPMFMIMKQILEVGERKLQGFIYKEMLSDITDNGKEVVQLDLSKVNIPSPIKLLREIKQSTKNTEQL